MTSINDIIGSSFSSFLDGLNPVGKWFQKNWVKVVTASAVGIGGFSFLDRHYESLAPALSRWGSQINESDWKVGLSQLTNKVELYALVAELANSTLFKKQHNVKRQINEIIKWVKT